MITPISKADYTDLNKMVLIGVIVFQKSV